MSKRKKTSNSGAMLELWRPPLGAGDPIGCLATTYTFAPALFDEQCLARFLEIESEPNREDLAFLLERESRLGGIYAGVLVDHTQSGVDHSLRWDVLPVRIHAGKQHAKLSLLVWSRHVRIIVASANLTEPGYRSNHEVAGTIDFSMDETNHDLLADAMTFLRRLLALVPGAYEGLPEIQRAENFLTQVARLTKDWKQKKGRGTLRQEFVFTLPAHGHDVPSRSSLAEAVQFCRKRGGSPTAIWIASPFFDQDAQTSRATTAACKLMSRSVRREIALYVPGIHEDPTPDVPRLAAPKSLITTLAKYNARVEVFVLPDVDGDRNRRPWHAKMLGLSADEYSALMIGSSNFTCAGMGIDSARNAEANLLTIVDRVARNREVGLLEAVWLEADQVEDPDNAEWLGEQPGNEEEEDAKSPTVPKGFLSATYQAGDQRKILLRLDSAHLPEDWSVKGCGQDESEILNATSWREAGRPKMAEALWEPAQPPEKLLVQWGDQEAFLPINVEDSRRLPPPVQLEMMSADQMLWILAAADPSAAFRAWARAQQPVDLFDEELDSATPVDLDPLRRYDLQTTFLHRVRRRAHVLAQLRANLQRPVTGRQALEWRLRGLIGIEPLADRFARELTGSNGAADEALLTLADFLIVLREVDYQAEDGFLPRKDFEQVFRPFLRALGQKLSPSVKPLRSRISSEMMSFWERVLERCQA